MAVKNYTEFTAGTYDTAKIFLQADAITGALEKVNLPVIAPEYWIYLAGNLYFDTGTVTIGNTPDSSLFNVVSDSWSTSTEYDAFLLKNKVTPTTPVTANSPALLFEVPVFNSVGSSNYINKFAFFTTGIGGSYTSYNDLYITSNTDDRGWLTWLKVRNNGVAHYADFYSTTNIFHGSVTGSSFSISGYVSIATSISTFQNGIQCSSNTNNGKAFYWAPTGFASGTTIWGMRLSPAVAIFTHFTDVRIIETTVGNCYFGTTSGAVGIGANLTLDASALLELTSTSQGLLLPRMTTAQKNAIPSPAAGLFIFDTDLAKGCYYDGTSWVSF